jgi:hypothetical protein
MSKYANYVEEGIQIFLELLCSSAIVLSSQVNDNKALNIECQFKPIVELSKSINQQCTKRKSDDEFRYQPNKIVKKVKEDANIKVKVKETNDECNIVIIDKLYSERYKKFLCYQWLVTYIPKQ